MEIKIRKETIEDKEIIYKVVKEAFESAEHSDGEEQNLVNKLRNSESYIEELSLVAVIDEKIIGHVMFTKGIIEDEDNRYESLGLAPLAILPEYQNKGIGSKLVEEGLRKSKELGYNSCIVLGSEKYYPRFGFKEAIKFGLKSPFEVPSENFMAIELKENALKDAKGTFIYAKEFFE